MPIIYDFDRIAELESKLIALAGLEGLARIGFSLRVQSRAGAVEVVISSGVDDFVGSGATFAEAVAAALDEIEKAAKE
jgi:hypothetical protein